MKINATGRTRSAGRTTSKKGTSSGSAFALQTQSRPETARPAAIHAASPVATVEALVALQGDEDYRRARKAAAKRAEQLLDALARMRLGLLEGGVSRQALHRLTDTLQQSRAQTGDVRMETVLNEIEVRAAVEKAKFDSSA